MVSGFRARRAEPHVILELSVTYLRENTLNVRHLLGFRSLVSCHNRALEVMLLVSDESDLVFRVKLAKLKLIHAEWV